MSFDAIIVFIVLAFILVSFYKEIVGPAFTFLIAVVILGAVNILTPSEILGGFANEQISVIVMLLLVGDIIRKAAIVEFLFNRVFKSAKSYKGFMRQMMLIIAPFSAFLNNTPLVAVMMPYVHNWSKRNNISPSKLLIPLSYAAILGGCATLIGTSTNLIVNGFVADQKIFPEIQSLGLFDFAYVGLPMMIIGFLYIIFIGDKLLPLKKDVISEFSTNARKYIVEARVRKGSFLIGKTIEEAGLRNLPGLFLVEILRNKLRLKAVSPDTIIEQGDILYFAGDTETIAEMIDTDMGLTLSEVGMFLKKKHTEVIEIVVSHNSSLINKTVKEASFRGKYDAAIIAVYRNGERIMGKIGPVKLRAGDALLLLSGDAFSERMADTHDFYLISKIKDIRKLEFYKVAVLLGGTALAIALSALGFISLFMGLIILTILILLLKIASPKDLYKSIDYNLIIIIALSLALGIAMIKSGVAEMIAEVFIKLFQPLGPLGILFGIYFVTAVLAAYITNKAAVAIIFPISLTIAKDMALNPMPFILIVAFAAAANFMTPIGYQTNLMVYGPGGYSFKDFFRIGFPLTIIYMIVTVLILNFVYF